MAIRSSPKCQKVIDTRIPIPRIGSGRMKKQLVSMNNWGSIHYHHRARIKHELKTQLKNWFLETNEDDPFDYLVITSRIIRHNKRKYDVLNQAPVLKVIEDILTELGWVRDDDRNEVHLLPSEMDLELPETYLHITVEGVKE